MQFLNERDYESLPNDPLVGLEEQVELNNLLMETTLLERTDRKEGRKVFYQAIQTLGKIIKKILDVLGDIIANLIHWIRVGLKKLKKKVREVNRKYKENKVREIIFEDRPYVWADGIPTIKDFEEIYRSLNQGDVNSYIQANDTLNSFKANKPESNVKVKFSMVDFEDMIYDQESLLRSLLNDFTTFQGIFEEAQDELKRLERLPEHEQDMEEIENLSQVLKETQTKQKVLVLMSNDIRKATADLGFCYISIIKNVDLPD